MVGFGRAFAREHSGIWSRLQWFFADDDAWHVNAGPVNPTDNAGAHPVAVKTGWGRSWVAAGSELPADSTALIASLKCNADYQEKCVWTAASLSLDKAA